MAVQRLFVGTFLAPEQQQVLGGLRDSRDELSRLWHRKLRFVNAVKLHMTWFFLGDAEQEKLAAVADALACVTAGRSKSQIVYDAIEFWPSPRKPRQLVLSSRAVPAEMAALGADIRHSLKQFAIKPDERQFRPHITLARFDVASGPHAKDPLSLPDDLKIDGIVPLKHQIDMISLIESHIGAGQDEYEVLRSFAL